MRVSRGRCTDSYPTRHQGVWWSSLFKKRRWIVWSSKSLLVPILEFLLSKTFSKVALAQCRNSACEVRVIKTHANSVPGKHYWVCFLLFYLLQGLNNVPWIPGDRIRGLCEDWLPCKEKENKWLSLLCKPVLSVWWSSQNGHSEHWSPSGPIPRPTHVWSHEWGSLQGPGPAPAVCSAGNHISGGAICPPKSHQSLPWLHESNGLQDPSEVPDPSYPKGRFSPPIAQYKQQQNQCGEKGLSVRAGRDSWDQKSPSHDRATPRAWNKHRHRPTSGGTSFPK